MDFSKPIRKRLKSKGWTQKQLAVEANISNGGLSEVLNGKDSVSFPRLIKIAQALNVSVWRLVKEAEQQ